MAIIGELLTRCRKSATPRKITQGEIAKLLVKDSSYLSRLEKGKIHHTFSVDETTKIISLFRDKNVPESLINEFIDTCNKSIYQNINFDAKPTIDGIIETLKNLDDSKKQVYLRELQERNQIYSSYNNLVQRTKENRIIFKDADLEYQNIIQNEEKSRIGLKGRLILDRSKILRYLGDVDLAETLFSNTLELVEKKEDQIFRAEVLEEKGDFFRRSKQNFLKIALEDYTEVYQIYSALKMDSSRIRSQIRIASIILTAGLLEFDNKNVITICDQSIIFAKSISDHYLLRKALEYKAWALTMLGKYSEATNLQVCANDIAKEKNWKEPKELAKSATYLAGFYQMCGNNMSAIDQFAIAKKHLEKMKQEKIGFGDQNKELFISALIDLGLGTIKTKYPDQRIEARRLLTISYTSAFTSNDLVNVAKTLRQLAKLDFIEGEFNDAQDKLTIAKEYFQITGLTPEGNPYYLCLINFDLIELALHNNRFLAAYGLLKETKNHLGSHNYPEIEVYYHNWVAKLLSKKNFKKFISIIIDQFVKALQNSFLVDESISNDLLTDISLFCEKLSKDHEKYSYLINLTQRVICELDQIIIEKGEENKNKKNYVEWVKRFSFFQKKISVDQNIVSLIEIETK